MAQYISKADVISEIERLIDRGDYLNPYECDFRDGNNSAIDDVKFVLDTIKVKDLD